MYQRINPVQIIDNFLSILNKEVSIVTAQDTEDFGNLVQEVRARSASLLIYTFLLSPL